MKLRGTKVALAALLSGALLLSACTSGDPEEPGTTAGPEEPATTGPDETEEPGEPGDGDSLAGCLQDVGITETAEGELSLTVGPGNWSGYNATTSRTYSTYNNAVADQMFSGFIYFGTDGTICANEEFGTYELISEDPMQVEYTISDDAQWSDGTPVTINDYLLDWAAQNPDFLEENTFDHVSRSFPQFVPEGPQGEVGSKTFMIEYSEAYPDWQLMVGGTLPAHIAAERSGLEPDELAQAILDGDQATVASVAPFWNDEWVYTPGELPDLADTPSSGPYMLKEGGWLADTALTLTANDAYWGTPAGTRDLIFRFMDDASMYQALENGDVNLIRPQATVDVAMQLNNGPMEVETGAIMTWEHLDFNFRQAEEVDEVVVDEDGEVVETGETVQYAGSVFADDQGGLALREAFALCVDRAAILDSLITPIDDTAVVMNAREVLPFQDTYDEVLEVSYDGAYDVMDPAAAAAKFEESGMEAPVRVRIGYVAGNERRASTVELIQATCAEVGFQVEDAASANFFDVEMVNGDWEVALFAWAGSGQIASGRNIYSTGFPQNYGHYSNEAVDAAFNTLAGSLDPEVHLEQIKVIEENLWADLHGIPLYAHPGMVGYSPGMQNVRMTAVQSGPNWNAFQWVMES